MLEKVRAWWSNFNFKRAMVKTKDLSGKSWQSIKQLKWSYLLSFAWFPKLLEGLVSMVLKLGTLLLVILFLVFFIRLFKDQGYFMQTFSVPKQLEEQGYNGQVVAIRVQEKLEELKAQAGSVKEDSLQLKSNQQDFDLSVLGVGLSLRTLAFQMREALGRENKTIHGEVTKIANRYEAQLRMTGFPKISSVQFAEPDQEAAALERLFKDLAEGMLYHTDPYRLALVLRQEGRYEEAIMAIRYLLQTNPAEAHWAYLGWGAMLRELNDPEGAIEKYKKSIELKPDFRLPYTNLAYIYQQMDEVDLAIAAFRRSIALDPGNIGLYNSMAWMLHNHGDFAQVDSLYNELMLRERGDAEARSMAAISWAEMKFQRGEFQAARKVLDDHYTIAGENVFSYLIKGVAAFTDQDTTRALGHFMEALELDPTSQSAINANVDFALMLNKHDHVLKVYRKAKWDKLEASQRMTPWNRIAMLFNAREQHDSAMVLIKKVIAIDTTVSYPYTTLAETHFFQGQKDSCYHYLEKGLALGFNPVNFDYTMPPYDYLKDQLQFQQLLAKYQTKEEELSN
ncbi:tetratricopeptide repeat protein [Lewinella sp. LCG006]|uniref:tetratricopeptide repeat protein n=1 Tax=Lewinella sp. LCG006 TaxID=3231911 RepID=UPI00345FE295